jgi:hypothetical protein
MSTGCLDASSNLADSWMEVGTDGWMDGRDPRFAVVVDGNGGRAVGGSSRPPAPRRQRGRAWAERAVAMDKLPQSAAVGCFACSKASAAAANAERGQVAWAAWAAWLGRGWARNRGPRKHNMSSQLRKCLSVCRYAKPRRVGAHAPIAPLHDVAVWAGPPRRRRCWVAGLLGCWVAGLLWPGGQSRSVRASRIRSWRRLPAIAGATAVQCAAAASNRQQPRRSVGAGGLVV